MDKLALTFMLLALLVGVPLGLLALAFVWKKPAKSAFFALLALIIALAIGTLVNSIIGLSNYTEYGYYTSHHPCTWVALGLSCGTMGFGLITLIAAVVYHFLPEGDSKVIINGNFGEEVALITACGNVGVGLWTSICISFASIFGVESTNYSRKMRIALGKVRNALEEAMEAHPEYEYRDFRVVKEGNLAYTGSVMGIKKR